MKLLSLRQDFETLFMRSNESLQDFLSRVTSIVNQMKSYGEKISEEIVVAKVLWSLTPKYNHVAAAIKESKNLSIFLFDELVGSLQAHDTRMKGETSTLKDKSDKAVGRGHGQGRFYGQGRGRGWGRGWFNDHRQSPNEYRSSQNGVQCHYCKKFGHLEANCWSKEKHAIYTEKKEEESKLFMACYHVNDEFKVVWFLDSGCSNHMSRARSMFQDLDESWKMQARLGDDKKVQVEGKGTIAIKTSHVKAKHLHNVFYVPSLAHNMVSIGQLIINEYYILFDNASCAIKEKSSGQIISNIQITQHKMFPLEISRIDRHALDICAKNESLLWHLRYEHLNINGLKLLNQKEMVNGLPKIDSFDNVCEGCIYGKQCKKPFPVGKAWRAKCSFELVHADLCRPMRAQTLSRSWYFLLFIDDYSHISWVYFLKCKSKTFEFLRKFKALAEK